MESDNRASELISSKMSICESSAPYADIECASHTHLLASKQSASVIFQGDKSSPWMKTIAIISLVISALCFLSLGGSCVWLFVFNNGSPLRPQSDRQIARDNEVCLPCLQVSPNPLENTVSDLWAQLDVRVDGETDERICCATNTPQYAALFKLILQRQEEVRKLADAVASAPVMVPGRIKGDEKDDGDGLLTMPLFTRPSVSAHLIFKPQHKQISELKKSHKQHWKSPSESPTSHVQAGLVFHENGIFVQTPGLYYVYCQILFSPSLDTHNSGLDMASTYVRRYSILHPVAPDLLLKNRHTRIDVERDRHSSYMGGVFHLHKGDTLFVEVSRPELVSHDDVASFFGLFRVGGAD